MQLADNGRGNRPRGDDRLDSENLYAALEIGGGEAAALVNDLVDPHYTCRRRRAKVERERTNTLHEFRMRGAESIDSLIDHCVMVAERHIVNCFAEAPNIQRVARSDGLPHDPQAHRLGLTLTSTGTQRIPERTVCSKALLSPAQRVAPIFHPGCGGSQVRDLFRNLEDFRQDILLCIAIEKHNVVSCPEIHGINSWFYALERRTESSDTRGSIQNHPATVVERDAQTVYGFVTIQRY
jgi:hypothetical protein